MTNAVLLLSLETSSDLTFCQDFLNTNYYTFFEPELCRWIQELLKWDFFENCIIRGCVEKSSQKIVIGVT